jgi:hypothetical protein
MSHQISREDFKDFTAATMLASADTKRLWVVASVLTEKVYYVICDRYRGDTLEVNSGSNIVYSFDEAIDLYNSIR